MHLVLVKKLKIPNLGHTKAIRSSNVERWKLAIIEELNLLMKNET